MGCIVINVGIMHRLWEHCLVGKGDGHEVHTKVTLHVQRMDVWKRWLSNTIAKTMDWFDQSADLQKSNAILVPGISSPSVSSFAS